MGLINFLGNAGRKVGSALRAIGGKGATVLRDVVAPVSAPLKSIANTVATTTGFNSTPLGAAVMTGANKFLDWAGSSKAQEAASKVTQLGDKIANAANTLG